MIKDILLDYKNITEEAIEKAKKDIDVNELIEKREEIIEKLKDEDKEKLKEVLTAFNKEFNIEENEKLLFKELERRRKYIKEELDTIRKRKLMRNNYGNNIGRNNFFNKKI